MKLSKRIEIAVATRTADGAWDAAYTAAKRGELPNPPVQFRSAYERGYIAGTLARCGTFQGMN